MSILNEDSGSLIIAEGTNQIQIDSSNQNVQKEEDLFELSRDDPTLSFQIQQQKKQQIFIEICEPSQQSQLYSNIENQQRPENKKKRKDIFQKFKKPTSSITSKLDSINSEDNLLNIFDSIFKTKCSQPDINAQRESKIDNNFLRPQTEIIAREKTPSSEKRQRLKIFGKKRQTKQFQGILPSQLLESLPSVAPVQARPMGSPIMAKKVSDSINFSLIQRVSGIFEDQNIDISRQEQQIKNILESEIFRDQDEKQMKKQIRVQPTESMVITSAKKIEIQMQQAVPQVFEQSSDRKQVTLSARLPVIIPKKPPTSPLQLDDSRVLRNEASIISNSPLLNPQSYEGNEGFKPSNSMANISTPDIADLTVRSKDNNNDNLTERKGQNVLGNNLVESQILQLPPSPSIIKVNVFQHEVRMPIFLREIRKHISIYPNLYLTNNKNKIECIRQEFSILFDLFTEAIKILSQFCQIVLDLKSKKLLYLEQLSKTLTLQFFIQAGWQKFVKLQNFETIKPRQPFESREWSYQKAKTALKNYENIIQYYKTKGIKLDINQDKGKRKYFQIRHKFWDICGNMKLISEDIYSQMLDSQFPQHFYVFLEFLRAQFPNRMDQATINHVKELKRLFKVLKMENDLLVNSEIGVKIKKKLDLITKYLIVY